MSPSISLDASSSAPTGNAAASGGPAAAAAAAAPAQPTPGAGPAATGAPVDWSVVKLGVTFAPTMFVARWTAETGRWDGGELVPYGPLNLMPAAQVLSYGQSIFEGLKAYRQDTGTAAAVTTGREGAGDDNSRAASSSDATSAAVAGGGDGGAPSDRILLFRPDANASRFEAGALRMCMPPVPPAMFVAAVQAVVRANKDWVPPASRGSLYLRPLLLGTGPLLGLCPSPEYTFVVYAVPVGSRAKGGRLTSLDYLIHDSMHRAAPRGVGATKAAGNYSPCLVAQIQARQAGCNDCIYLDAKSDTYLEEGTGCNIFVTHGSVITTPPAAGSILPGVTRASLLQLAGCLGYRVREAPVSVAEAMKADEMFASGTAVVVQPVGSVTYRGSRVCFGAGSGSGSGSGRDGSISNGAGQLPADGAGSAKSTDSSDPAVPEAQQCPAASHRADSEAAPTTSGHLAANGAHGANGNLQQPNGNGNHANGCDGWASGHGGDNSCSATANGVARHSGIYTVPSYGYGSTDVQLTPEQLEALAAAAPPPDAAALPPGVGPVAQRLYGLLTSIQYGRVADPFGWVLPVDLEGPTEGPLHLDEKLGLVDWEDEEEEQEQGAVGGDSNGAGPQRPTAAAATAAAAGSPQPAQVAPMDSFGRAKTPRGGKRGCSPLVGKSVFADPNLE